MMEPIGHIARMLASVHILFKFQHVNMRSHVKWVPGGGNLVKGVQYYELYGVIELRNHACFNTRSVQPLFWRLWEQLMTIQTMTKQNTTSTFT